MARKIGGWLAVTILVAMAGGAEWGALRGDRQPFVAFAQDSSSLINDLRGALQQGQQAAENKPEKPPPASAGSSPGPGSSEGPCPGGGMRLLGVCSDMGPAPAAGPRPRP
jgi:hypothetical protein